jgi:outer membrane protein
MQSYGTRVFDRQMKDAALDRRGKAMSGRSGERLRALAAVMVTLASCVPSGFAQQAQQTAPPQPGPATLIGAGAKSQDKAASALPAAPVPTLTEPFDLRTSSRDFSKPAGKLFGNPVNMYRPTSIGKASFANSVRLTDLVKDGKIYLSLSDAIALAIENNYDIAIARYDLDIADTDILRTKTGQAPLGVPSGLVTNTLSGTASAALASGGGPGGTTVGSGGAGSGVGGVTFTTAGAGPAPQNLEGVATAAIQFDRSEQPVTSAFIPRSFQNTDSYNFTYNQGFVTGTSFALTFDNSRVTTNNFFDVYSPQLDANFKATVTQQLLQGAGIWVNKRFIYQARNDRRIADSTFRQQILYTVNQVETIYWGLVQAYEDVQAKERALEQSTKLDSDDRKQLEIGTVAPLQVVNDDATVATDKQALISSQNALNYQQQIIKQAIARNLNDPALSAAPVIPTDRVTVQEIPEEKESVEQLVQTAFQERPELEQAVLTLRNDEITLKGARNALLPTFNIFGYYGGTGIGGAQSPSCYNIFANPPAACKPDTYPTTSYGGTLQDMLNNSTPDRGMGFNVSIPIGNKLAQSVQARSLMEYRQAELHLEQLYIQIRMQVVNAQFALTNDRAQVQADIAARDYAQQSVDAEIKKLHLGASTSANVLLQQRSLALAEDNLIAANGAYAKDRAGLYQILATTLQHYGINLQDSAAGVVKSNPVVPGIAPAPQAPEPNMAPPPATPPSR